MTTHLTGTREEWLAARLALLQEEKELTHRGDDTVERLMDSGDLEKEKGITILAKNTAVHRHHPDGSMTVINVMLTFPFVLLALAVIAVLGPSLPTLIVVIGLSGWVTYARVLRSQVLVLRSREFVDAIHALGGSVLRVIARHVLPNVLSSLVVIATLELARAIVLEATLSFLGLGVQPPTPSWGGMVQEGREYLDSAWWISTAPGIVLMLTSIVVSRTGDWLRDLLDPRQRI